MIRTGTSCAAGAGPILGQAHPGSGHIPSWLAGLPWTSRDHRPERLRPPPHPLGVQPARRARPDHRPRRHVGEARLRRPCRHRPRRALRVGRVLPGRDQGGHQADHRRRDLRRPAVDAGQGGQGRQPALPPGPAGHGHDGLPEPEPAPDGRAYRRLLLQAADRPGTPRQVQPGPRRHVRLPQRRDPQGARGGRLGAGPKARRRVRRHLRQGPVLPRAPGPRHPRAATPERADPASRAGDGPAAGRDQRPSLRPPGAARGARRPAVRRHRQQPRHPEPDAVRWPGVLPQDRGRDVPAVPGPARGVPEHPSHRRDGGPQAAPGRAADPAFPGAGRRDGRDVAAQGMRGGPGPPLRRDHPAAPAAPGLRAGRDHLDGLRGLLPDRGGLRPVCAGAGDRHHLPRDPRRDRS